MCECAADRFPSLVLGSFMFAGITTMREGLAADRAAVRLLARLGPLVRRNVAQKEGGEREREQRCRRTAPGTNKQTRPLTQHDYQKNTPSTSHNMYTACFLRLFFW